MTSACVLPGPLWEEAVVIAKKKRTERLVRGDLYFYCHTMNTFAHNTIHRSLALGDSPIARPMRPLVPVRLLMGTLASVNRRRQPPLWSKLLRIDIPTIKYRYVATTY